MIIKKNISEKLRRNWDTLYLRNYRLLDWS